MASMEQATHEELDSGEETPVDLESAVVTNSSDAVGADGSEQRIRSKKKSGKHKKKSSKHRSKSKKKKKKIKTSVPDGDDDDETNGHVGATIVIAESRPTPLPAHIRGKILVTGCAGYIGAHTCKALIEAGYRVRGTVQNLDDKESYEYLLRDGRIRFPPAADIRLVHAPSSTLEFIQAKLSDGVEVWEHAMRDCDAVIHIAGPSVHPRDVSDARKQLFVPIVAGTSRVVQAAINSTNIKRFIFTSTVFALSHSFEESLSPSFEAFSEENWNMDSDMKANAFGFCKTIAERATQTAFNTLNENATSDDDKISYASVLPASVVGAPLSGRSTASVDLCVVFAMQGEVPMDIELGMVAVKDVASAYVKLMDNPDATGRFILWGESHRLPKVADSVKRRLGRDNQMVAAAVQQKLDKVSWRKKLEKYAPRALTSSFDRMKGDSAFMKELIQVDGLRFDVTRAQEILGTEFSSVKDANVETALWATQHGMLASGHDSKRRESKKRTKISNKKVTTHNNNKTIGQPPLKDQMTWSSMQY